MGKLQLSNGLLTVHMSCSYDLVSNNTNRLVLQPFIQNKPSQPVSEALIIHTNLLFVCTNGFHLLQSIASQDFNSSFTMVWYSRV